MIVVTDTSVVLNLAFLRQEGLLPRLYAVILAPPTVREEFVRLAGSDQRFRGLRFPAFIGLAAARVVHPALREDRSLDPGEVAAMSLALERGIRDVLMDERAGRAAALALGLRPSGLLGVLVQAKQNGWIPRVSPLIDALENGARFRVSADLRERILRLADETF